MKYNGGCHCGRIALDVDAEIRQVIECNCSICSKRGYLLAFMPAAQVHLHTPEADLSTYTFNKHAICHQFCSICGVAPFGRGVDGNGNPMFAVNVRCLDGIDLNALQIRSVDGRSL